MLENFIISRICAELPFVPNAGQHALLQMIGEFLTDSREDKIFLLRGYAGTGKTSIVSGLVRALGKLRQPCVLLAPTGRAAKVLSKYSQSPAYTIHKHIYRQERQGVESFGLADNRFDNTLFIVDEASMISAERDNSAFGTGNLLDDLIHYVYCGRHCSILMLGDDAQLPPVGQTQSSALNDDFIAGYGLNVRSFTLTEVARQALDSGILNNATNMRERLQLSVPQWDSKQDLVEYPDIKRLSGGEELLEQLEHSLRDVGVEDTIILTRSNKRTNLYNQGIRARILWREDILNTGDRLLVSRNNYYWTAQYEDLPFLANGDILEVIRLRNERELYGFHFVDAELRAVDYDWEINVTLWIDTLTTDSPEQSYQLQKTLYERIAEDYPEIRSQRELRKTIMQSPYYNALQIRYAYAVTCHKAQGGQWRHVYIDPGIRMAADTDATTEEQIRDDIRWMYTAVTRATEQVFLLNC